MALGIYASAALMLVAVVHVQWLGDRTPLGMLALFGPRHLLPWPWVALAVAAIGVSRPLAVVALLGGLGTLGGVAGFEIPRPAGSASPHLRLVSYNTDRSRALAWRIREDLAAWDADVAVLLDCKTELLDSLRTIAPDRLVEGDFNCLVTRLPVTARERMPQGDLDPRRIRALGRAGLVERYTLDADGRPLTVYVLHLESPRDALFAARSRLDFSLLRASYTLRGADSRAASRWIDRQAPGLLVVGDFNLTPESRIYRDDWGDLANAFGTAGWGFGHTMFAGRHRVRIDHVLTGPSLRATAVRVLRGYPSEHQPVLVDLRWQ